MVQRLRGFVVVVSALSLALFSLPSFAQNAGQNVNMVSGTDWTTGDPFLQRQNEPSIAVSTRNAAHLLAGANDYRAVDIPGLLNIPERGDAWIGVFKSFDGGQTWRSTLLPGFRFDGSNDGLNSPLQKANYQAAADPIVRAGSSGMFYVGGIAFNRGTFAPSSVFISRFIDNNNRENGDPTAKTTVTNVTPTDSVRYLGTQIVANGTPGTTGSIFVDKPWLAVDIPRGTKTCTIKFTNPDGTPGQETIPAGNVYMTYTAFNVAADGSTPTSTLNFVRSTDCGVTWSAPIVLSQPGSLNQGSIIAISPVTSVSSSSSTLLSSSTSTSSAKIYVAWRRFANSSFSDAIMIAQSENGGASFEDIEPVVSFPRSCVTTPTNPGCVFEQGITASGASFRTNAYPTMTVDDSGRVYVAWAQRQLNGDGRIMMTVSSDGEHFITPAVIDNGAVTDDLGNPLTLSGRGHQFMPSLSFNSGKLMLAYYDLRQDHTLGLFTPNADLTNFNETRQSRGEVCSAQQPGTTEAQCGTPDPLGSLFADVFGAFITDATLTVRRHTLDLQGAQASPATPGLLVLPRFSSFRISRYLFGINKDPNQAEQLQVNAPNLPLFVQGTQPFIGDYIDIAGAPSMVFSNGKWQFNTAPTNNPIFHASWTDNRDIRPPFDGNWQNYAPPFSAANPSGQTNQSVFDPNQTVPVCIDPNQAGMRNQNIYTSRVAAGLVVTSPGNAKPLGLLPSDPTKTKLFQRAFTINVLNAGDTPRQLLFITGQPTAATTTPAACPTPLDPTTASASFNQFCFANTLGGPLGITIAPHTSVSRPVFVQSPNPNDSVQVQVGEIDPATPTQLLAGGLQAFITLNPDPTTPTLINAAGTAGLPGVNQFEVYNPTILNPTILNPTILNPTILNPTILNPTILNPTILNPTILNDTITNQAAVVALNPTILNPTILNPTILNNSVATPTILNPAIGDTTVGNTPVVNQQMTDASYVVQNVGNTSSSYAVKLFGNQPPNVNLQLIVVKNYVTPDQDACNLTQKNTSYVITNVLNPTFANANNVGDPLLAEGEVSNSTVALAPGETAQITIRAYRTDSTSPISPDELQSLVLGNVTPVVVAHPVNTQDAARGITTPQATIAITTPTTLPDAVAGKPYPLAGVVTITTVGGAATKTFSIPADQLPSGLTLDPNTGVLSGTPSVSGTFTFTVTVSDGVNSASRVFTLHIAAQLVIATTALPDGVVGTAYSTTLTFTGGTGAVTWSVSPATALSDFGLSLDPATGAITGTPTKSTAGVSFTVTATDSGSPSQTTSTLLSLRIATPLVTTTNNGGRLPDVIVNVPYSQSLVNTISITGGIGPYSYSVSGGTLPTGLTLSSAGVLSGTVTSAVPTTTFQVTVTDSSNPPQGASVPLSIAVVNPLTIVTQTLLPDGIVGKPYSAALLVGGGTTTSLSYTVVGTLPPGITFANGTFGGTPTAANTAGTSFTIQVSDSGFPAQTTSKTFTIRVGGLLTVTTPPTLPIATPGVSYSTTLSATGGIPGLTWSLFSGTLPPGLTLSPAGVISGTPSAPPSSSSSTLSSSSSPGSSAATFTFTVKVVDSGSPQQSATQTLSITVAQKYRISFYVQPSNTSPGAQITPSVKVLVTDMNGNGVRGAVVNITLAQNPGGAVLSGTTTATTGNNGIAIFASQSLNKSGIGYQMQASAPALAGAPPALSVLFNVK